MENFSSDQFFVLTKEQALTLIDFFTLYCNDISEGYDAPVSSEDRREMFRKYHQCMNHLYGMMFGDGPPPWYG